MADTPYISQNVSELDGTAYRSISGSVSAGAVNSEVALSPLTSGQSLFFKNLDTVTSLTIRLSLTTNDAIAVAAGEELTIDDYWFDHIYLSNASGSPVNYKLIILGN